MKRFKRIYAALFVLMIIMGAISACGGGGGGGGGGDVAVATVTGRALDSSGAPVAFAEVTVTSTPVTVLTDIDGRFSAQVEVGSHTFTILMGTYTIYQGIHNVPDEFPLNLGNLFPTNPYYSAGATWYRDLDGDLYSDGNSLYVDAKPVGYDLAANLTATAGDCDDNNAAVNPAATEVCNNIDDNCVGGIDEGVTTTYYADTDTDNYGDPLVTQEACVAPANYVADNTDCDDTDIAVNPGATEICNGIDDNCAGGVDEGVKITFYADTDIDSYGNPLATTLACIAPAGYVTDNTDCDDTSAAVNPGATEVCNGIDDNCAGGIDEGVTITFYADTDTDTYGDSTSSTAACSQPAGYVTDNTDCDDTDIAVNPGATEVCNSIDDNCNGGIDEGLALTTFYYDSDSDAYGDSTSSTAACAQPAGYVTDNTDCDDTSAAVNPGAAEVCNDIDDNCDGGIDEGLPLTTFYADSDSDSYGDSTLNTDACAQPLGYVIDNTDCNDFEATINPGATEICNGLDDNCVGGIDEGVTTTFYADVDTDTFGDPADSQEACVAPAGYVTDNTDCDDTDIAVNPGATEVCNGIDDNCAGGIDEGVTITFYADTDTDTFGDPLVTQEACTQPAGFVADNTDCDDTSAAVNPGATEVCNGIDDNCVDGIDEGVGTTTYYADSDIDTYGNPAVSTEACAQPAGYVTNSGDCDDTNAAVNPAATEVCNSIDDNCNGGVDEGLSFDTDSDGYTSIASCAGSKDDCNDFSPTVNPGATEVCNSIDDDCDGSIDEGVSTTYYADADVDTYGDPLVSQPVCTTPPAGYVTDNTDCDDTDAAVNPAAQEVYNDVDDDCDGEVDDGILWYRDADLDGYSNGDTTTYPPDTFDFQRFELLATTGDCNDSNGSINPGEMNCYGIPPKGEVLISAGGDCFLMGAYAGSPAWSDEQPVHEVCFTSDFYMDRYEVTNAEYEACVDAGECWEPPDVSSKRDSYYGNAYYDNYPVIYADWNEAAEYCSWQGKRLPTAAEWEYAARGGNNINVYMYPWGNTLDSGNYANYYTTGEPWKDVWVLEDTSPVGFYAFNSTAEPNGYGLYDIAGNVHEWVSDWYSPGYYGTLPDPVYDPTGPAVATSEKSSRGGAWLSPRRSIRVSMRHSNNPVNGGSEQGIRCVRDVPAP